MKKLQVFLDHIKAIKFSGSLEPGSKIILTRSRIIQSVYKICFYLLYFNIQNYEKLRNMCSIGSYSFKKIEGIVPLKKVYFRGISI